MIDIKGWISKSEHKFLITIITILIFAVVVRIYFFLQTVEQPLFWDEAEYMSTAVHWIHNVPYELNPQRPPLFQLMIAILIFFSFTEPLIKLLLVIIPSILCSFTIYLLGKEMYNKTIGMVGAFLFAVNWSVLFWSMRIQPDFLSIFFQILAILYIWKYWKYQHTKHIIYAALFVAVALMFKVSALLVLLMIFIFALFRERLHIFKDKNYYYFALVFLATLIPYFIWSYINFGTILGFKAGYSSNIISNAPFYWGTLKFFQALTENLLLILFIAGIIYATRKIFYIDIIIKDKKLLLDPDIFGMFALIIISSFYIFYIRGAEDRWLFLWLPFIFYFVGTLFQYIYNEIKNYSKFIAFTLIIGIIIFIGYQHLQHADEIINAKKYAYKEVKEASLWIKENSNPDDIIFSKSVTQMTYYARRQIRGFGGTDEEFKEQVQKYKPKYIVFSVFEFHGNTLEYPQKFNNSLEPVKAYQINGQPVLVIYRFKNYDL